MSLERLSRPADAPVAPVPPGPRMLRLVITSDGASSRRPLLLLLGCVLAVHLCVAFASRHGIIQDDAESYTLLGQNLAFGLGYVFKPGQMPIRDGREPGRPRRQPHP